jgi:nucleotide-binding universal stress UspA family protein
MMAEPGAAPATALPGALRAVAPKPLPAHVRGRIVVGASGSPASGAALRAGADLARATGVPLIAVHARSRHPLRPSLPAPRGMTAWPIVRWSLSRPLSGEDFLREMFALELGGIPTDLVVHLDVATGDPAEILVQRADRRRDVLVLGRDDDRRPGWRRGGRVAAVCSRRATCGIFVVPYSRPFLRPLLPASSP